MATYHVTAVPKAGMSPSGLPLGPRDITASSDEEARGRADGLMGECVCEWGEHLCEGRGEAAAAEFAAWAEQWQPQVRQVNRPTLDVNPRSWTTDSVHNGKVVGTHYHYGDETGEQAFDVLADGKVAGLLVEGRRRLPAQVADEQVREIRVWRLSTATGVLAGFAGRQWEEDRPVQGNRFAWPAAALAGIRAELEK